MRKSVTFIAALAVLALGSLAGTARSAEDSGSASAYPWSGYWWAHSEGGLTGPLSKYDKVYSTKASVWEASAHPASAAQEWFGHCHAWSAAAVTEKEPRENRNFRNTQFSIGDQKGLICALHAQDEATSYGDRYGDGNGSEDRSDLTPDEVWRLLQLYVKQRNIPLIFDLEAGQEVWNYPVYQYQVTYEPAGDGWYNGTMQLVFADDDVTQDYLGTQPGIYTYTFRMRFQGGSVVAGSGQWTGESVEDHPDFAWYPYVARAENPHVDVDKVAQIVGFAVGGSNNPPQEGEDGVDPGDVDEDIDGDIDTEVPDEEGRDFNPDPVDQPVDYDQILDPIEFVALIANKTSHFALDIFVDRNDGGQYKVGEPIRCSAESGKAGYLYLFDIDPQQNIHLVFPRAGEPNFIEANKLIDIPADGKPYFLAQGPGQHHLRGIVTAKPLALTGFHTQVQEKNKGKAKDKPQAQGYRSGTQKLRVPPAKYARVRKHLNGFYSKDLQQKPPAKVKQFAQDDCLFIVTGKGKPDGKQQKPGKDK